MCLGIPGKIVAITDEDRRLGLVEIAGTRREISLACIAEPDRPLADCLGSWVLVHVGFALARIGEEEARATLAVLEELGEVQEELAAMRASGS